MPNKFISMLCGERRKQGEGSVKVKWNNENTKQIELNDGNKNVEDKVAGKIILLHRGILEILNF